MPRKLWPTFSEHLKSDDEGCDRSHVPAHSRSLTVNRAIIVGASSGIGRELAMLLSRHGYSVGVTGRRRDLLADLAGNYSGSIIYEALDRKSTRLNSSH